MLFTNYKNSGRLVVTESGFPTLDILQDAKNLWNIQLIATQHGSTAHLPVSHAENIKTAKVFGQGFSKSLHCGVINLTHLNDNNVVVFLDNDIPSGRETWNTIDVNKGEDEVVIHVRKLGEIYREVYCWLIEQISNYHTTRLTFKVLGSKVECSVAYVKLTKRLLERLTKDCVFTLANLALQEMVAYKALSALRLFQSGMPCSRS